MPSSSNVSKKKQASPGNNSKNKVTKGKVNSKTKSDNDSSLESEKSITVKFEDIEDKGPNANNESNVNEVNC